MQLTQKVRQFHRWMSVFFTVTVLANMVAFVVVDGMPPPWVTYSPLPPLFLLWLTGAYLFVLPYTARGRARNSGATP